MAPFSLGLKGISVPLKVWPSKLLCFCFFNRDPDTSVMLADWACFVMVPGRDDVVAVLLDFFKAVAAAVASADA
jgi:hypothetical protein